jgi:Fur family ferric uptake transcriptional regulator
VIDVAHRLRSQGYRLTPQRQLIWEALRSAHAQGAHLSAEAIHGRVSATVADLNVASVYRTLTLLSELGLATEVQLGDGRGYWELAHADDAIHLHCRHCRRVDHHQGELVSRIRSHLHDDHRFVVEDVDVVVHGLCEDCAAQVG